ncbi:MAG: FAD-dependent oxidoreductase [Elusimicrobiota bacterium]|jgi:protoporphyrinogen oxidase
MPSTVDAADVLILGAGLTGLAAAERLAAAGSSVLVVERAPQPGGLARTLERDGFRFDLGGHRLYFQDDRALRRVVELVGETELLRHPRLSSVCFRGRFLPYPPGVREGLLQGLPLALGLLRRRLLGGRRGDPGSLRDWVVERFGEGVHDLYFRDYSRKVWGLPTERISAAWADRRIGDLDLYSLARRIFIDSGDVKENASYFLYPRRGVGALTEALAERVGGGRVLCGAEPLALEAEGGSLRVLRVRTAEGERTLRFGRLVSTVPLTELARLLPGGAPVEGVRYRALIVVHLALRCAPLFDEHWVYFPEEEFFFSRLSETVNWSPSMAPAGCTGVTCEVFCDEDDAVWRASDDELVGKILASLRRVRAVPDGARAFASVVRVPFAYPLLYAGYEAPLAALTRRCAEFPNLRLAGRTGTHSYYDMEECLLDAWDAAAVPAP